MIGLSNREKRLEAWNIYNQPDGICFYRIKRDKSFDDVYISIKILIKKDMRVKIFNRDDERSDSELEWLLLNNRLQYWTQFDRMMITYQSEPDIQEQENNFWHLQKALDHLQKITPDHDFTIETIRIQLKKLIRESKSKEVINTSDLWDEPESVTVQGSDSPEIELNMIEDEGIIEYLEESENELNEPIYALDEGDDITIDNDDSPATIKDGERSTIQEHSYYVDKEVIQDIRFASRSKLSNSSKTFVPLLHNCSQCTRLFISAESLMNHMNRDHELTSPEKCAYCDEYLETRLKLKKHWEKCHQEPFICEFCGVNYYFQFIVINIKNFFLHRQTI